MPDTMNSASASPEWPRTPRAAYLASTSSRAAWTIRCNVAARSRSDPTAITASTSWLSPARPAILLQATALMIREGSSDVPYDDPGSTMTEPHLTELDRDECVHLLLGHQVGRIAVTIDGQPHIVPVTYAADTGGDVVFRTGPDTV